jgi:hypothetical protein
MALAGTPANQIALGFMDAYLAKQRLKPMAIIKAFRSKVGRHVQLFMTPRESSDKGK